MFKTLRILLCAVVALTSCKGDVTDSVIPEYNVHYSCNATLVNAYLQQTEQVGLDCQGGYVRVYGKRCDWLGRIADTSELRRSLPCL